MSPAEAHPPVARQTLSGEWPGRGERLNGPTSPRPRRASAPARRAAARRPRSGRRGRGSARPPRCRRARRPHRLEMLRVVGTRVHDPAADDVLFVPSSVSGDGFGARTRTHALRVTVDFLHVAPLYRRKRRAEVLWVRAWLAHRNRRAADGVASSCSRWSSSASSARSTCSSASTPFSSSCSCWARSWRRSARPPPDRGRRAVRARGRDPAHPDQQRPRESDQLTRLAAVGLVGGLTVGIAQLRSDRERDAARLSVQYGLARILADADSLEEAGPRMLAGSPSRSGGTSRACGRPGAAPCSPHRRVDAPRRRRRGVRGGQLRQVMGPGFGLPGEVWEPSCPPGSGRALVRSFTRVESARKAGLRGAVAFPIRVHGESSA